VIETEKEAQLKGLFGKYSDEDILILLNTLQEVHKERQRRLLPRLPVSIFSLRQTGILETTIKYLKENYALNYSEIALHLRRYLRAVWAEYNNVVKKSQKGFRIKPNALPIAVEVLGNGRNGPLESLMMHLSENYRFYFTEVSTILNIKYRSILLSFQS
jgi:hypothetical protein